MQKEEEKPNWYRIVGNAGVVFFTSLTGMSLVGVPSSEVWSAALIVAGMQAALSACKELRLIGGEAGKALANSMLL